GTMVDGGTVHWTNPSTTLGSSLTITAGFADFSSGTAQSTGTLTLSGGALAGTDTLTVTGAASWTGGEMTGTDHTGIGAGVTLTTSGSSTLSFHGGRTLDNAGTVTWTGTGNLGTGEGAVWNNQAGALFDLQSDVAFINWYGGTAPQFTNAGTLRKSAGTGTAR